MHNIQTLNPGKLALAVGLLSTALLSGCGDDKKTETKDLTGVWQKAGYGEVWQISPTNIVSYYHNKMGCVKNTEYPAQSSQKLLTLLKLNATGDEFSMPEDGGYIGRWSRIKQLSEACQKPLNGEQSASVNFEFFWQDVQQYYAFLPERKLDWQQIYQQYQPLFATATPVQEQLYYREIIRQFNDAHVDLTIGEDFYVSGVATKGFLVDIAAQTEDPEQAAELETQIQQSIEQQIDSLLLEPGLQQPLQTEHISYGLLPGNIGYVRFNQVSLLSGTSVENNLDYLLGFPAELKLADTAMQEIKQKLAGTQAMVLDLRFNFGGDDQLAFALVSHFNQQSRVIGSKSLRTGTLESLTLPAAANPYLQPLLVLTGGMTVSAGEVMALALQSLPQATLIGEPTQGSFSNALERSLPNGGRYRLSNELYLDPQKQLLEVQGVLPDISTAAYVSLDQPLGSVTALDVALQQIKATPLNSPDQTSVQQAVSQFRQQFNQPGLAAALIRNGKVVHSFADGMADVDQQIAMTADTPVLTASISKTMLGTALGLLNINPAAPLPALPLRIDWPLARAKPLSWRELAQHQSGILDHSQTLICAIYLQDDGSSLFNLLVEDQQPCAAPQRDHQLFLTDYLQQSGAFYQPENFGTPGETHYSNVGAELASLALEQQLGEPFANWSAREIFAPLQLKNTSWPAPASGNSNNSDSSGLATATEQVPAQLYIPAGDELLPLPRYSSSDFYAGSLHSSAHDLARYLAAIASKTPQYPLPGFTAAKQQTVLGLNVPRVPGTEFPGLFWHKSGDFVGHTGLFVGANSLMYYNTATETGLVLLLNSDGQYWLAPDAAKTQAYEIALYQLAGQLYRHALAL
jgi:CubicO group peptidase (beta-lactamase class C family)